MKFHAALVVVPAVCLTIGVVLQTLASVPADAEVSPPLRVPAPSDVAAHTHADQSPTPSAHFLPGQASSPQEVREVLRLTRGASLDDRVALRDAALHSPDPLVAGNAVRALGRLGVFHSDTELMTLLDDPRARVRQDAVAACGLDGGAESVPYLAKSLSEGGAELRPLVVDALGRIGGSEARALVESVVEDPASSATEKVFAGMALARMEG